MVKIFLFFSLSISLLCSCSGDADHDPRFGKALSTDLVKNGFSSDRLPEISFEQSEYSFGKVNEGEVVKTTFRFTNTGKSDLIIGDAKGSCGCTVAKFPTEPLKPGKSSAIEVEFNTAGKRGTQRKTITLITNSEPSTRVLAIKGEVIPTQPN